MADETILWEPEEYIELSEEEKIRFGTLRGHELLSYYQEQRDHVANLPSRARNNDRCRARREQRIAQYLDIRAHLTEDSIIDRNPSQYSSDEWSILTRSTTTVSTNDLRRWMQLYYRPTNPDMEVNVAHHMPEIHRIRNREITRIPEAYMMRLYLITHPDPDSEHHQGCPPSPQELCDW